jgi:hypothetical protein
MAALEPSARTGVPGGFRMKRRVTRQFSHAAFTLVVSGFDVVPVGGSRAAAV